MGLVYALAGLPEKLAPYEALLTFIGTVLAVVIGSMLSQLVAQPGFRKFMAFFGVKRAVDEEQNDRIGALEAKMDTVVDAVRGNRVLLEAQGEQLKTLKDSVVQIDDDSHTLMDMLEGYTTAEINRRREQRRRRREVEVLEGGRVEEQGL